MPLVDDHEPAGKRTLNQVVLATGGWGELGQWRMHRTAVIALGIILKEQLPIGPNVVLDRPGGCELRQVETAEAADQSLVCLSQGFRLFRQIDEEEAFPAFDRDPVQWIVAFD